MPLSGAAEYFTTVDEAGAYLREGMEARLPAVIVYYQTDTYTQDIGKALFSSFLDAALQHTGVPTEGDYIRWHYAGYQGNLSGSSSDGIYYLTFTFTFTYNSTADQEAEVDTAVADLLSSLDLSGSSYENLSAVYDWICQNITYDYENLEDDTYTLKHTAYAALINRTAVCQGYALLLYRLALEMGIDCRLIAGLGNGGNHGWNIVKLGSVCYNVDATWDAGRSSYSYYLKCPDNFPNHVRDTEYETAAFHAAYPMSEADYDPITTPAEIAGGTCGENLTWSLDSEGTLTISGIGAMYDYDYYFHRLWRNYNSQINAIVVLPGVTTIGKEAFYDCKNAKSVSLPEGLVKISSSAFYNNEGLEEVLLPSTVEVIESSAFCCTEFASIRIPASVTELGDAFEGNYNLESIWADENNPNYSSDDKGILLNKDKTVLIACPQGYQGAYSVPDTVTAIEKYAFSFCDKLTAVSIPRSVRETGAYAFFACRALQSVTAAEGLESIGNWAFGDCDSLTSIHIPNGVTGIGMGAFAECYSLTEITFCGDAPEFVVNEYAESSDAFQGVTATAYYPAGNATWTEAVMQDYGGTITWVPVYSGNLPGDINGNGKVNNQDLTVLFQYLSGWDVPVNENALDVNGDGKVNNQDLTILFQYLSGWNVKIY